MIIRKYAWTLLLAAGFAGSCSLDSKMDAYLTDDMKDERYETLLSMGFKMYTRFQESHGFNAIDNNLFATVSDEAQYVTSSSSSQRFNEGSWGPYYNPDNYYAAGYQGINDINAFLEYSVGYKDKLAVKRDTLTLDGERKYEEDVLQVERFIAEAHALRAYYHFELAKRYGAIPIMTEKTEDAAAARKPRQSFDEVAQFIAEETAGVMGGLVSSWTDVSMPTQSGRVTQNVARAIKARALLYAASPLHNPANDPAKWIAAARAYAEIINTNKFSLYKDYRSLFLDGVSAEKEKEIIWAVRFSAGNSMERKNYPIGTAGGNTGVCPTHDLFLAHGHKTVDANDPYAGVDPRFTANVAVNGSSWNGRTLEMWPGGVDDPNNPNTSRTGYYLKKFLNENLNLVNDEKKNSAWPVFRYAEVLLSYAEAMNEAFGPDDAGPGEYALPLTAREAVNMVRGREGVKMPEITAAEAPGKAEMQLCIRNERRVELAFEGYRYWDLCRWKIAAEVLNRPVTGVKVTRTEDASKPYEYATFEAGRRKFQAPKMYLYPIPQEEIVRSQGTMEQNAGW